MEDEHIRLLSDTIGSLPITRNTVSAPQHLPMPFEAQKIYAERKDSVQSSIRMGMRSIPKSHPDWLAFSVVNEALGGYFGSRLMKNLREEKGVTYGVFSSLVAHQHGGYAVIGTDVKKEALSMSVDEIHKEIKRMVSEPIPKEELTLVKNYTAGSFVKSQNTPVSLGGLHKSLLYHGLDKSFYDSYTANVYALSAEELLRVAQLYLGKELLEVKVG